MSASEDIRRLESKLEQEKADLHEDAAQLSTKVQETRSELSPTNIIQDRVLLLSGIALALGFILSWRSYRAAPVIELGEPRARSAPTTVGKPGGIWVIRA
jgi:hypothetical protein